VILCPDHLIAVWEEELKETIPGAIVHRFDKWKEFTQFFDKGHEFIKDDGKFQRRVKRWSKPKGPEWYIVGRNQAKWYPDWRGVGEEYRGFEGRKSSGHSRRHIVTDKKPVVDEKGHLVYNDHGFQKTQSVTAQVVICPTCGSTVVNNRGIPVSADKIASKQHACDALVLVEVPSPDSRSSSRDRRPAPAGMDNLQEGKEVTIKGRKYVARTCGERLWNYTSKPYRWAPARIIQKKLKRFFKYLIVDEVHEQKSDESAQSMAAGKLMSATRHTLALTGTLIGGYASHLFPLMVRMTPKSLRDEGFAWGKDLEFSKVYGKIDRIVTTKMGGEDCGPSVGKRVVSMRRARTGTTSERSAVRPGIMPVCLDGT
jgi:hypothetical protein